MFDDLATSAVQSALAGLSLRQRVSANNIANIETPGFLAGQVNFEDALSNAVGNAAASGSSTVDVQPSVTTSNEAPRQDGNNVNIDEETLSSEQTNLQYQLMLRALDDKFNLIHDVVKGS